MQLKYGSLISNWAGGLLLCGLVTGLSNSPNAGADPTQSPQSMSTQLIRIEERDFGKLPDGTVVKLFTLRNARGMTAKVMTYGATITELDVPDRHGQARSVVLGTDTLEGYLGGFPAPASVIGRVANRIAKAQFTLDGVEYKLAANDGANSIHGGRKGFAHVVWQAESLPSHGREAAVRLTYLSKDGEEGYPGNLTASVTFTLTDENEFRLDYEAKSDKPTLVNLTNHAYFNLAGSGNVLGQELWIAADHFTPADAQLIPTGAIASVKGTPIDFTTPTPIGAHIEQVKPKMNGYDHNFILKSHGGNMPFLCARASDSKSGRTMEVFTSEPGMQLYTGNHLQKVIGTGGAVFSDPHPAFCLETQHYPDAIHHPDFPSTVLRPGHTFKSTTVFRFTVR
jgi:aldose 1-epimerase